MKENEQQLQPKSKVTTESLSLSVDIAKQWYNKKNQNNQIYLKNIGIS